jgi:predicted pyridoxine 5'-phosphate oxidase superfamily flavin-nucleotide-binding protein
MDDAAQNHHGSVSICPAGGSKEKIHMPGSFGSLVFTPVVKALQERHGSREQYERFEKGKHASGRLGPQERAYLADRDSFYMASLGSGGWPYVQHRGGPRGFLKVIDEATIAFADFRGNKQYISTGNLMTDDRVALILVDYPRQLRLKILGHAEILEGDKAKDWIDRVGEPAYKAVVERVFVIRIEAFDWNCQQHIIPRFTQEEIQDALAPVEKQVGELQVENASLRQEISRLRSKQTHA